MMQLARSIGEAAASETPGDKDPAAEPEKPAAKRGRARAAKLSSERRTEIAKKAARTRWKKKG
jgi:hypothetical protein